MQKHKVYTAGYQSKKIEWLENHADSLDALILDIRYSPRSMNPTWSRKQLIERFPHRYTHLRALGNKNYKGISIQINDLDAGIEIIDNITNHQPVILLCVCSDPAGCHRTMIGDTLKNMGFEVLELSDLDAPPDPEMMQGKLL